ncbi:MAG: ABC transporter permease [Candidatus Krumholzibacteriota bacterium]|nr:ABC transporter permease [Candidatus Krumholzibacteriota bacterium]
MWRTLFQEFVFDLKNQRTRLVLTLVSIIWGTMSVVLLLAFGFGLEKRMREGQMNARDAVVSVWSGETSKKFQGLGLGRNIYMHKEDIALLKNNIPLVDLISPSFGKGVRVSKGDNRTTTYAEGVSVDFKDMRHMFPRSGGRFLNENDIRKSRRVVFIGDELALSLFGDEEPVGDNILIDDIPYTVVGVMQPKLQTSMSNGPDSERVIIPYTTFSVSYQRRWINHMLVRPSVKSRSKELVRDIRHILGKKYRFDPTDKYALSVWDDIEMEKIASKIFLGLNIFFGVIGTLTLVIAGVGVANIMYVVVKERTRELGIKRAAGAKRKHIVYHFVGEAFLITGGGGVLGIIFSLGVIGLASLIPIDSGVMKYMGHPIFSWHIAVVTVTMLVLIALLSGIFPARQAADIEPVEALRYE